MYWCSCMEVKSIRETEVTQFNMAKQQQEKNP